MNNLNPNSNNPIIEEDQRLSDSIIWQLQRNFFSQQGADAWRKAIVPHYITSNPYIAAAYAKVMIGWLRDIADTLDASQPVYIIELGTGSGRLSYHFLKNFFRYLDQSSLRHIPVTYVMTDFAESTLKFWQEHHQLKSWVESGRLDFAIFDAEADETFMLIKQGVHLTSDTLKNPLGLIANYFFDGLTQDVFFIEDDELYESLLTLTTSVENPNLDDPDLLSTLDMAYEYYEITPDYYIDDAFNKLLAYYAETLNRTHLLFPIGSLDCIKRLLHLSNGKLFLLTGDKGYHHEADLEHRGQPLVKIHGSFSMMVNYHIISQYTQAQGGIFLSTPHRQASLDMCAMLFGSPVGQSSEAQLAYHQAIVDNSPDDFFAAKKTLDNNLPNLTFKSFIAYLRFSGWDSGVFLEYLPRLFSQVDDFTLDQREELLLAVNRIWDIYYYIGEADDLAFALGNVLFALNYHDEAVEFLKHSLTLYGNHATTLCNLAMCYYEIDELETALDYVKQALSVDPKFEKAHKLQIRLQDELSD